MANIKYCLSITTFTQGKCHKVTTIVEQVIFPNLGFNRIMPSIVLYGPQNFRRRGLIDDHIEEQALIHTESFISDL